MQNVWWAPCGQICRGAQSLVGEVEVSCLAQKPLSRQRARPMAQKASTSELRAVCWVVDPSTPGQHPRLHLDVDPPEGVQTPSSVQAVGRGALIWAPHGCSQHRNLFGWWGCCSGPREPHPVGGGVASWVHPQGRLALAKHQRQRPCVEWAAGEALGLVQSRAGRWGAAVVGRMGGRPQRAEHHVRKGTAQACHTGG